MMARRERNPYKKPKYYETTPPDTLKIGGKTYRMHDSYHNQAVYEANAKRLRKMGFNVRMVRQNQRPGKPPMGNYYYYAYIKKR